MNQVTQDQKDSVTKTFAIVGFVVAILFAVWLAVQVVSVIPSAFSSLASIADGVYNYSEDQTLTVATADSVANTGEAFTLSWTQMNHEGTYSFSYQCAEGASIDVRNAQGEVLSLDCGETYGLGNTTSLDVIVTSEKQRFTDVTYTVLYSPEDIDAEEIEATSQITIVNVSIPTTGLAMSEEEAAAEGQVAGETTTEPEVEPETLVTNTGTGLTAGTPTTVEEIIYAIPTSDPNGKIDLQVTYLGVGSLTGKTFSAGPSIDIDEQGAFKFQVTNIGTKTSKEWGYEAHLPSGIEYTSGEQDVLKPNEKAIITIGFEGLTQTGVERFGADITAKSDVDNANNSFTWAVNVVK
ncbi:MAG: hypothetical protein ACI9H6_000026 [Patiriisocius sp.]|jgi:hypothetical protein